MHNSLKWLHDSCSFINAPTLKKDNCLRCFELLSAWDICRRSGYLRSPEIFGFSGATATVSFFGLSALQTVRETGRFNRILLASLERNMQAALWDVDTGIYLNNRIQFITAFKLPLGKRIYLGHKLRQNMSALWYTKGIGEFWVEEEKMLASVHG